MPRGVWLLTVGVLAPLVPAPAAALDEPWGPRKAGWADVVVTAFGGDGIRFNNPYRLSTVLGSQAQSLSRTASYADVGLSFLFTDPTRLTAGVAVRTSFALEGVEQAVMTPSFLLLERWSRWALYGRAGLPLVVTPDVTWGFEGGAGAVFFLTAGVGLAAELVGDVFYGAGTREVAVAAYPVLSGQGGLWLSWEMLP
jgi:hypothetical protein